MSKEFKLEHEGQFRLVADLLTEGFLIHNDKAEIVMHNRAVLNLLGLNELQLKNIKPIPKYFKMMCGDSGQEFQLEDLIKNVINDRMEIKNKIIGVQIDDQMNFKWMHLTCRLLFAFDSTDAIYTISNLVEVTSIQNKNRELSHMKLWNTAIMDSVQLSVISTDTQGVIQTMNRYAEDLLGYEANDVLGKMNPGIFHLPGEVVQKANELSKIFNRKIEVGFEAFIARAKYQNMMDTQEWTYVHKNGSRIPILLTVSALKDEKGNITGYLGIGKNLTMQKQQQKIQSEQKRLLEAHIHALNESAIVAFTDVRGVITYVNTQFEKISGYQSKELIGRTHSIINSGMHEPDFFKTMWQTIADKKIWRGEVCNRSKIGKLYWVDSTIVPILDSYGNIEQFVAIRYDITARKNAELSLIQNSKMSSLGEMASGIAHEINNPLAIIQGRSSTVLKTIKRGTSSNEEIITAFESIILTSQRIAKIIKGLRHFSRSAENDPMENVSLGQIMDDTLELCKERLGQHGIDLIYEKNVNVYLQCRSTQIAQVLLNLLNNAFDVVSTSNERWIKLITVLNENALIIKIINSGKKIDPLIAQKVLEPFFTTKPVGEGTGLGLSIAKGIIEDHHGKLFIDLEQQNTCFVIQFPINLVNCEQQSA